MYKINLSPFLRNLVFTSITSFAVTISLVFVTRFLAQGLGPEEFGAYSLARRLIANTAPFVILSMGVSLRRYVAMTDDKIEQGTYVLSAFIATGLIFIVFLAAAGFAGNKLSYLIFQEEVYTGLYYSSLFFIGGYCVWVVTSSFLFGMQKIQKANVFQLLIVAIYPLLIAFVFANEKSAAYILACMGIGYWLSFFILIAEILKIRKVSFKGIKLSFLTLIRYGIPRIPGDFAFAGLFTLGPFLASHYGSLKDAGFFVIGQYVLRIMEAGIIAFGMVALPKIAQLVAKGKDSYLKENIENLLVMIFQLGLFLIFHAFLWSKEILLVWIGPDYSGAVPVVRLLIISLAPYLGYVMLRSVVDAIEVRAINTLNLFVSLSVAVIISISSQYAGFGITGLALGSTMGFSTLGILTSFYLIKRYTISFDNFLVTQIFILNTILIVLAFFAKQFFVSVFGQSTLLIAGFFGEAIIFLSYFYYLYRNDVSWILGIKRRVFQG
jgi:O-antigen/teichoic acid export membrane protein